ncbi:glyceraldehyde-3-phosphate dehydrogenase [Luteibaculum oceani]|uniref:Glyceraldehyde-3-phosphate dehydrogenase n=1 Tax=Luteibaculum oceani TaxID=1294296 RepID=A0A5C6V7X6_9FLAO|nr:glyceraldehyde-3-phosphate dehydrogenase [Luteibaculum oceani]TXC81382.1 glyceraldehyde-3-phosphate dehydrogenase [Luteibaculum oceani]
MEANTKELYSKDFAEHLKEEKRAVDFISYVGKLLYDKNIELVLFRNHLVDCGVSEIINLHRYANEVIKKPISIETTTDIAALILEKKLKPAKIDVGLLASEWQEESKNFNSLSDFIDNKLAHMIGEDNGSIAPKDVILFGFGRIGRLAARELIKQAGKGQQLRLRAIVTRGDSEKELVKRAALLRNDSVHGLFQGTVSVDVENKSLIINGQRVHMIAAPSPESVDYTAYGIEDALLIDNTGVFKDREALGRHLKSKGVSKVILTAPGKEIPNIVYGVNHKELDIEKENIYSAASCTTNAIVPVLKVINDHLGVEKGHIETVHAYTNDQNLLDNMHGKSRRGRSAAINMVITETGAGKAVTKCIPELQDKLTANAVRVPTPNGSLAILSLTVGKECSVESVNELLKKAALQGELVNQINFAIEPELVSSDIIGNTCCSVFDSNATIVSSDKKNIVLYVWYDNEFGYTKQVIRLAKYIAKVRRLIYY